MNLNKSKDILNEFRLLPVGLTSYTKLNYLDIPPIDIFSSKDIETQVIIQVENSSISKPVSSKIKELLNNRKIIVGYTNPSKFNFVKNKIKHLVGLKRDWALGFYDYVDQTVYIILDDNIKLTGSSKYDISSIIIHELSHMAAFYNSKTKIISSTMNNILVPYYKELLKLYYTKNRNIEVKGVEEALNNNIDEISNTISLLVSINERFLFISSTKKLEKALNLITKLLITLNIDSNNSKKDAEQLLQPFAVFYVNDSNFVENDITSYYHSSYKKFGFDTNTIPGQELVIPSEILAIFSQNKQIPSIYNSINKIPMR